MGRFRGIAVGVVVLAFVVTACSSSNNGNSGGSTGGGVATSPAGGGGSNGGGGSTASITAQNFSFTPDSVNVSAGTVKLTVTNKESTTEHTFTLDDGSSSTNLDPGKTVTITLHLTTTVGWHCSIHPSMTGTLNVS
ncbi:MAG: cupredoxin domain-containing protein [Actinomycetota bacterium]